MDRSKSPSHCPLCGSPLKESAIQGEATVRCNSCGRFEAGIALSRELAASLRRARRIQIEKPLIDIE